MSAVLFSFLIGGIAIGLPVALALAIAALAGVLICTPISPIIVVQRFFTAMDSFPIMAIPFFMIAGLVMERGGISRRLIDFVYLLLGKLSGGLAIVTVITSAFFGALTGSSPATVAAVGGIMIPAMIKEGYDEEFALATGATAGYLGPIIPPSILFVTFGVSTSTSIGALFIAGIIPGILLALGLACYAYYIGRLRGYRIKDDHKVTGAELWKATREAGWALFMPIIILGGIYGGIFTPTEAACVAVFYGIILSLFIYREITWKDLPALFKKSAINSALVMFIIACATAFGYMMTRYMIPMTIARFVTQITSDPIVFLMIVNVMLLILGTFMESNAAIMLTAPILMPIALALKIDPILFGVVMVVNLCIGMITPPLGVNLYVAAGIHGGTIDKIVNRYLIWYLIVSVAILMFITYIPAISLTLPNLLQR
jgi:C4-dicarboxylate transporter DctM subunit